MRVEDAVFSQRVGELPDRLLALGHLQPVEVGAGRVGFQGPGLLGATSGGRTEGECAEERRAGPEGVALRWVDSVGQAGVEEGGALGPVEGDEVVVGARVAKGEVRVVHRSEG